MTQLRDNRLVKAFAALRSAGRKTLIPFISAGHPDLQTTEALLADFQRRGVRVCELGIPFSDPIADGPIIQGSYTQALAGGVSSEKVFTMVRRWRDGGGEMARASTACSSPTCRWRRRGESNPWQPQPAWRTSC